MNDPHDAGRSSAFAPLQGNRALMSHSFCVCRRVINSQKDRREGKKSEEQETDTCIRADHERRPAFSGFRRSTTACHEHTSLTRRDTRTRR